jgi:hypothetical protein
VGRRAKAGVAVAAAALALIPRPAFAYRPFDGTDGAVAELHVFELEIGPVHYYREGQQNYAIAPNLVLNLGILEDTELVIDASNYVALGPLETGVARDSFLGDDVLVKHVFREGVLQGKTGVSIAAEGGLLTPEIHGDSGFGASLDVITSYAWSFCAVHWNEWFEYARDQHADLFTGIIVEGPPAWTVRPVTEIFFDEHFGGDQTGSVLVGAIWTVRDDLAFDAGVRGALVGAERASEVRAGLTWAVSLAPSPRR